MNVQEKKDKKEKKVSFLLLQNRKSLQIIEVGRHYDPAGVCSVRVRVGVRVRWFVRMCACGGERVRVPVISSTPPDPRGPTRRNRLRS